MGDDHEKYVLGEPLTVIEVQKPLGVVLSVRLDRDLADRLFAAAENEGARVSAYTRYLLEKGLGGVSFRSLSERVTELERRLDALDTAPEPPRV